LILEYYGVLDHRQKGSGRIQKRVAAMTVLGTAIRKRRIEEGLRLQDVADISCLSVPYLSDIERGRHAPTGIPTIHTLAETLNFDPDELRRLAYASRKEIRIPIESGIDPIHAETLFLFARQVQVGKVNFDKLRLFLEALDERF
jgi:transcriptional regulator with XRE-family HTH domain